MAGSWIAIDATDPPCSARRAVFCATKTTRATRSSRCSSSCCRPPKGRPILAYLYRVLTHRCLNVLRDEKNRARLLERETPALRTGAQIAPETLALGVDTLRKLAACVDEAVMETVVYRYLDEMGQEEIAKVMAVSRKTVQNRLARAEQALRALAEETRDARA